MLEYLYNIPEAGVEEMLEISLWDAFSLNGSRAPYAFKQARDAKTRRPQRHTFIFSHTGQLVMANQGFSYEAWARDPLMGLWRFDTGTTFHSTLQLKDQLDFILEQPLRRPIAALGPAFFSEPQNPAVQITLQFLLALREKHADLLVYACEPDGAQDFPTQDITNLLKAFN